MMQLNFGGADGRGGKMARFELGPVYCSGSSADKDAAAGWREGPRGCRDLWRRGVTQVGNKLQGGPPDGPTWYFGLKVEISRSRVARSARYRAERATHRTFRVTFRPKYEVH